MVAFPVGLYRNSGPGTDSAENSEVCILRCGQPGRSCQWGKSHDGRLLPGGMQWHYCLMAGLSMEVGRWFENCPWFREALQVLGVAHRGWRYQQVAASSNKESIRGQG